MADRLLNENVLPCLRGMNADERVSVVTRLTTARLYTEGTITLFGNGVLEIGADLNGATAGDFTRSVSFGSGGGFSAFGANRTVNLGGAGAAYTWASGFVPDGKPFILSSPYADATLIFANLIDLNERAREFRVRNAFDTLELLTDSVIETGSGSATLSFSDCSAKSWTGALAINGKLGPTTLRFGTDGNGHTPAQLAAISNGGYSVFLDGQGCLRQNPPGTVILIQ